MKALLAAVLLFISLNCQATQADKRWHEYESFFKKELKCNDWKRLANVFSQFRQFDRPEAAAMLLKLIEKKKSLPEIKLSAADILAGFHEDDTVKFLLKRVNQKSNEFALSSVIFRPEGQRLCRRVLLKSRDPKLETLCLEALDYDDLNDELYDFIYSRCTAKSPYGLRRRAINKLGAIQRRASIPLLISLLDEAALAPEALRALQRLTGELLPAKAALWHKWFKKNPDFKFYGLSETLLYSARKKAKFKEDFPCSQFFNLPLAGRRPVFIFNRSSSSGKSYKKLTRFEFICRRLELQLAAMPEQAPLALKFPPQLALPRKGMSNRLTLQRKLKTCLKKIRHSGQNELSDCLSEVFFREAALHQIDTLVIFADCPSDLVTERFIRRVRALNLGHNLTIHTLSWSVGRTYLKEIASASGGQFQQVLP